jgi:hypothetical protein
MSAPDIGSMQLFDAVQPAIGAGLHAVTSTVVITPAPGQPPVASPDLSRALHRDFVLVGGTGLSIQPTEVLACHPPRNGTGQYEANLPHVVLARRTLPWERSAPGGAPWLALLVFAAGEVGFSSMSLSAAVGPTAAAEFEADEPGASGTTVDVVSVLDTGVLAGVLPSTLELSLLSHVRRVNTADTTLDMNDDDGWLAVVVANRLPLGGPTPVRYHACLVSLEHRGDLFSGGQPVPASNTNLLLLYRWDFTTDVGGTFGELAEDLDTGVLGQPADNGPDDRGRTSIVHTVRDGTQRQSTYRGPLTIGADALPADDTADISYDAAYELGRLLGAADGPFTRNVVDWHRAAAIAAHSAEQQATIRALASRHAEPDFALDAEPAHIMAAASGLAAVVRSLAPRAPHRPMRASRTKGGASDD